MNFTKLFALGEREEIHDESKIHQTLRHSIKMPITTTKLSTNCAISCVKLCKKQTEHNRCHDTPGLKPHQCRFCQKSLSADVSVNATKDFSRLGKIVVNGVRVKRRRKTPLFLRNPWLNRPPAFILDGFCSSKLMTVSSTI